MGSVTAVVDYRKRRKNNLIRVCDSKCNICGYNKAISALEFHHIVSSQKLYGIGSGTCHDLEDDLLEIKKCILVCANCHREIHEGNYSEEELWKLQKYSDTVANELRLEKSNIISKTKYYCSKCGKEITKNASGLCSECFIEVGREKWPSRDELKHLIRTTPFTKIGKSFNVSDNAVRKWCIAYSLPSKKSDIQKYDDIQWEKI